MSRRLRRARPHLPWHNWVYAGYYLFLGIMGLWALVWTPVSIEGNSGLFVVSVWGAAATLCAVLGEYGTLRPNFRIEMWAAAAGMLAIAAYSTSIFMLTFDTITRGAQAWGITAHVWPLLLRIIYIYRETKKVADTTPIHLKE